MCVGEQLGWISIREGAGYGAGFSRLLKDLIFEVLTQCTRSTHLQLHKMVNKRKMQLMWEVVMEWSYSSCCVQHSRREDQWLRRQWIRCFGSSTRVRLWWKPWCRWYKVMLLLHWTSPPKNPTENWDERERGWHGKEQELLQTESQILSECVWWAAKLIMKAWVSVLSSFSQDNW